MWVPLVLSFPPAKTIKGSCPYPSEGGEKLRAFSVAFVTLLVAGSLTVPSFSQPVGAAPTALPASRPNPDVSNVSVVDLAWWDFGSNDIFFDFSSDGGLMWHQDVRVNDVAGSASGSGWQIPLPAMNVNQDTGAIYVAWPDVRNGNFDIYFSASTDGGQTWSANARINDDTGSATQYMVDLAIDSQGMIHSAWEDKRNGNWNIYYSNSSDGGQTWTANLRISSEDTPGSYNRPGDYFAVEAAPDDSISIVWTDGRGSDFDIYYARSSSDPAFSNVRITNGLSPHDWQVEPTMAINRSGSVIVGWKETNSPEAAGLRVGASSSTDQGQTWAPNILMNQSHPGGGCSNSDPWMSLSPEDRVQYAYLEYNCRDGSNGLNVANTTDGQDWGAVHYVGGAGGLTDKESIAVDLSGSIYTAWDEGNVMIVTWSDDGGSSWASFRDPDDHPGGVLGAIIQTGLEITVATVTVTTDPLGLRVTVDGVTSPSPVSRIWPVGSAHTVSVSSPIPIAPGSRYLWLSWSDDGALTHEVIADADLILTARFVKQHQVSIGATPGGRTVLVDNVSIAARTMFWWYDGVPHWLEAPPQPDDTPDARYEWRSWSDGMARSHSVAPTAPLSLTATFDREETFRVTTSPEGLRFFLDDVEYSSSQTLWFEPGSSHFVFVPPSQSAPGARHTFVEWSDGGSFAHPILFSSAMSLEARFRTEFYLTVTSPFGEASGSGWYDEGTIAVASLRSTSIPGATGVRSAFVGWTGDAGGAGTVSSGIVMDGPKSATAAWRTEYFLQVDSDVGTVEGTGWYPAGGTVQLNAPVEVTQSGSTYRFAGWTGGAASEEATITISMAGPMTVRATWDPAGGLGPLSSSSAVVIGLAVLVVVLAAVVGRLAWRRRRRD